MAIIHSPYWKDGLRNSVGMTTPMRRMIKKLPGVPSNRALMYCILHSTVKPLLSDILCNPTIFRGTVTILKLDGEVRICSSM